MGLTLTVQSKSGNPALWIFQIDDGPTINYWAEVAQSVLRLATGWSVRGSNPVE